MSKKFYYRPSTSFTLLINEEINRILILMQLHIKAVNTRFIPHTASILGHLYPSVLHTKCYNDQNLPFRKEVQATEIGHLFEHILLEELCVRKLACGHKSAVFNGRTNWNWITEPRGLFHITVDADFSNQLYIDRAIEKSIAVTELVLAYLPETLKTLPIHPLISPDLSSYLSN